MDNQLPLINKEGRVEGKLYLIPKKEKLFTEAWLQKLLISNPSLLPVHKIDSTLGKLIPLGREVLVTVGAIDNLYVTTEGTICIVETKLWRNPESHRTVVAQIIDYAKDLANMGFEEFQNIVEKSQISEEKPKFWDRILKHDKNIDQIEFQSKIQESLNQGRFLLLIVGDKIYPEVAMLVDTIQSAPNLEFKFGLIEILFYKTDKENTWPLVAIPNVVGKTHEVIRSVVRIVYENKKPEVETATFEVDPSKTKTNAKTFKQSMPKGFADLFIPIFDRWINERFIINWGVLGFSIRFPWKEKIRSIVDIYPTYISLLTEDMVKRRALPLEPYHIYRKSIDNIPLIRKTLSESRRYLYFKDISLEEFEILIEATDKIIRDYNELNKKEKE